jgi:hypothetical protein
MKKLSITLLLSVMILGLSSCDSHFWSVLSGSRWYAVEGVEGYSSYPIYTTDYDYMEIQFYTNGTGNMSFYDDYGYWGTYGFEWDDRGDYVIIYYYDGGHDTFYYDYDRGYLYLSRNPYMQNYTVFSH